MLGVVWGSLVVTNDLQRPLSSEEGLVSNMSINGQDELDAAFELATLQHFMNSVLEGNVMRP